jgi:hypothetical protein
MNEELSRLISLYQASVADLFPRLAKHLKVELPIRNIDWTAIDGEQRGETGCGITYFIHGYGVSMAHGNTKVDFDLGDKGQIDGIDPWKLWSYVEDSNIKTIFSSTKEVEREVKLAVKNGEMTYSGYMLYYLAP